MRFFVIRHGLTEMNKTGLVNGQIDEPLIPEGVKQVEEAREKISQTIKYIYSSPLLRSKQTAEILNSQLHCPIFFTPALNEVNLGSFAGLGWDQMEPGRNLREEAFQQTYDYRPQGGEFVEDVKDRLFKFLKEVKSHLYEDDQVLMVTSGGIIRMLYKLDHDETLKEIPNLAIYSINLDKILTA